MGRVHKRKRSSSRPSRTEESERSVKMIFDKFDGELWELCRVKDNVICIHYVKRKDMDQHIIECKKKILMDPTKVECPYNPLHVVYRIELQSHTLTCENRVPLFNSGYDFEPKRELIEGVRQAPLNTCPTFDTYWENDESVEATYDAEDNTKFRNILRPTPPGLSKKKKKEFRAKERQRHEWLTGKTKEKLRASPYPAPDEIRAGKVAIKTEATIKEEADVMNSIIDGLSGAKIGDPRNGMVKQINAKLKVLKMMRIKLQEEEIALQRQVEEYLLSIRKTDDETNGDPRLAGKIMADFTENVTANVDPRTANSNHASRILPDIMSSVMIR